jgi:3-hydroxyacyl-[acyl-carrier-protein] dehydratase
MSTTGHETGTRVTAVLQVPTEAAYFDDHFPRRPVFPGTLLMDCLSTLALGLARDLPTLGEHAVVSSVRDAKIRAFTAPGQQLELAADVASATADLVRMKVAARRDGRTVATARIDVARSA